MYKKQETTITTDQALELSKQIGTHVESVGYEYVSGPILLETYGKHFFIVNDGKFLGNNLRLWDEGIIFETTNGFEDFFKQPINGKNVKIHIRWGSSALEEGGEKKPKK